MKNFLFRSIVTFSINTFQCNFFKLIKPSLMLFFVSILLIACKPKEDKDPTNTPKVNSTKKTIKAGVLFDSAVEGVSFSSGRESGETDSNGKFTYEDGSKITFSIGKTVLGTSMGGEFLTPVDLVENATSDTNDKVGNILYLLQNMDDDGDPTNGISISERTRSILKNTSAISLANADNSSWSAILAQLRAARSNSSAPLITIGQARNNFKTALTGLFSSIKIVGSAHFSGNTSQTQTFKAYGVTSSGSKDITNSVTWKSLHTDLATITNNGSKGIFSPVNGAKGSIVITASYLNDLTAATSFTLGNRLLGIEGSYHFSNTNSNDLINIGLRNIKIGKSNYSIVSVNLEGKYVIAQNNIGDPKSLKLFNKFSWKTDSSGGLFICHSANHKNVKEAKEASVNSNLITSSACNGTVWNKLKPTPLIGDFIDSTGYLWSINGSDISYNGIKSNAADINSFQVIESGSSTQSNDRYLILSNGSQNSNNPNKYSRLDWTIFNGDIFVCFSATDKSSASLAKVIVTAVRNTPNVNGCSGSSSDWIKLGGAGLGFKGDFNGISTYGGGLFHITHSNWISSSFYSSTNYISNYDIIKIDYDLNYAVLSKENKYYKFQWTVQNDTFYQCWNSGNESSLSTVLNNPLYAASSPTASKSCGVGSWSPYAPLTLVGDFIDEFGNINHIDADKWVIQKHFINGPSSNDYQVDEYKFIESKNNYLIAINGTSNTSNAGKYSRIDWLKQGSDFYYCFASNNSSTATESVSVNSADNSNPIISGCGNQPWTKLSPKTSGASIFADAVINYSPNLVSYDSWSGQANEPSEILGETSGTSSAVVSLGFNPSAVNTEGGAITVTLGTPSNNYCVVDGNGKDFKIHENMFTGVNDGDYEGITNNEAAFVEVSQDGTTFYRFPTRIDNAYYLGYPEHFFGFAGITYGGDSFDLKNVIAHFGLPNNFRACFIKIIDVGTTVDDYGAKGKYGSDDGSGIDIDALEVIHYQIK